MPARLRRGPLRTGPLQRRTPQARIVEVLLLGAWAEAVAAGRRAAAEREAVAALDAWVGLGLACEHSDRDGRLFDLVEVQSFFRWAGLAGLDDFFAARWAPAFRAMAIDLAGPDGWPPPGGGGDVGEARFRITCARTFNLDRIPAGSRVRLRMPLPLDCADHGQPRILAGEAIRADGATVSISSGRLMAVLPAVRQRRITLEAEIDLSTINPTEPRGRNLEATESALYLRSSEGAVRVTRAVETLAFRLAGRSPPMIAVQRFWAYLLDELCLGAVPYETMTSAAAVDWVLDAGWFDCRLGAALLVSLCRARGIPARMVGGNFLYGRSPTNHHWSEVWIDGPGWLPFDVTAWDLSSGGLDAAWRGRYAGRLEPRMVTERPPMAFTGPIGVAWPDRWRMLQAITPAGVSVDFVDMDDDRLIYRDEFSVRRAA